MKKASGHSYIVLDGMRGVAAGAVVVYHVNFSLGMTSWLPNAYLAVDLFFVLSGFVLAHAYEPRFGSGMTIRRFMAERLIRLYPLYILAILVPPVSLLAAKLMGVNVDDSLRSVISALPWNACFLPVPQSFANNVPLIVLNGSAWSLLLELIVNFAFVAAWRLLTNNILILVIALALAGLILCTIHFGTLDGGATIGTSPTGLARVFYSFPLGVLLCRLLRDRPMVVAQATALPLVPLIGTGLFLGAPFDGGVLAASYSLFAVILISPVLVAVGSCVDVRSIVTQRLCAALGAASYGVYVLHAPMMFPFLRIVRLSLGTEFADRNDLMTATFVVIMFPIALVIYRFYDLPIRAWLKLLLQRRPEKRLFV